MADVNYTNSQTLQYVKELQEMAERQTIILKEIKFDERIKTNDKGLYWSMCVSQPDGFTPSVGNGRRTLADPEPYEFKEATATPANLELTQHIPIDESFANAAGIIQRIGNTISDCSKRMGKAGGFRLEDDCIYGQLPIATVGTVAATNTGEPVAGGPGGTMIVDEFQNRPAWFYASIGKCFDFFVDDTEAAAENTERCKITSWDPTTRTLGFSCALADVAAIDALTTAYIYHEGVKTGESSFVQMKGLVSQFSTQTGNLFGVPVAYPINRPGYTDLNGATPDTAVLLDALASIQLTSGQSKVSVYASSYWWTTIAKDLSLPSASVRNIDASYSSKKVSIGSSAYDLAGLHDGLVEIKYHPGLKAEDCLIINKSALSRTGATDWTFRIPGLESEALRVPGTNVLELYAISKQMIVATVPSMNYLLTGAGSS
jgi:hypothetical protein